jgi:hypothetical protein
LHLQETEVAADLNLDGVDEVAEVVEEEEEVDGAINKEEEVKASGKVKHHSLSPATPKLLPSLALSTLLMHISTIKVAILIRVETTKLEVATTRAEGAEEEEEEVQEGAGVGEEDTEYDLFYQTLLLSASHLPLGGCLL